MIRSSGWSSVDVRSIRAMFWMLSLLFIFQPSVRSQNAEAPASDEKGTSRKLLTLSGCLSKEATQGVFTLHTDDGENWIVHGNNDVLDQEVGQTVSVSGREVSAPRAFDRHAKINPTRAADLDNVRRVREGCQNDLATH